VGGNEPPHGLGVATIYRLSTMGWLVPMHLHLKNDFTENISLKNNFFLKLPTKKIVKINEV